MKNNSKDSKIYSLVLALLAKCFSHYILVVMRRSYQYPKVWIRN